MLFGKAKLQELNLKEQIEQKSMREEQTENLKVDGKVNISLHLKIQRQNLENI